MSATRIAQLADIIKQNTTVVDEYFSSSGIPSPSFAIDGPSKIFIPPDEQHVRTAHAAVLSATQELRHLMMGPAAVLTATDVGIHL
jgi:hypothetical protein